ncbi:restriction endonuclease subunit M [Mesoplasma entomophilum]|uniref:Methyltransferase n=1 Tax=Mesoplasma entomophilum TaxID=2149 RepID=A0A3S5XZ52_9MOLU|nr:site-specific DNA-methyltransferase [Mesoplasma entomophilum]ATQ35455.1 site-specific DNA-methyltransferase [Mesoplasma entomophilum]ATZ19415.1 restriction endonuclease subunit M [Mesoplasma entomophilum]
MEYKKNQIVKGDVFKHLKKIDFKFDLIISDPPYNQINEKWDIFKSEKEFFDFTFAWIDLAIEKLSENGQIYIFNNQYNSIKIANYLLTKGLKFQNWIVWNKKDGFSVSKKKFVSNQEVILFFSKSEKFKFNYDEIRIPYESLERIEHANKKGILKNGKRWFPNPNGKMCTDVWEFSSERHNKKVNGKVVKMLHPTPKPEKLIERIILASSDENDLILDLFAGTGTTSFIAKKYNRQYIAIEKENNYVSIIKERLK